MIVILLAAIPLQASAQGRKPASSRSPAHITPARPTSIHFAVAPAGNEARFVVREQLMTFERPNDAIGRTSHIAGGVTIAPDGSIDPAGSTITVELTSLKTDKANRDTWIKSHTLKTDSFPNAVLVVKSIQGLPSPLPSTGTFNLRLLGTMTIHGVTRPATWDVRLVANGNEYSGTATTHLRFEDYGMEQPRLMIVMSVIDDVRLEYDFHFTRQ